MKKTLFILGAMLSIWNWQLKATTVNQLDSIVYIDTTGVYISKTVNNCDTYGNDTVTSYFQWNKTTKAWILTSIYSYSYDASNNKTLESLYLWNNTSKVWTGSFKYERSYDKNNNDTLLINYNWDFTNNKWTPSSKTVYVFDEKGNTKLLTSYSWSTTLNAWNKSNKNEYYFENNIDTLSLSYIWNSQTQQWINSSKNKYFYANNLDTVTILYNWNSITSNWNFNTKNVYNYDNKGNNTLATFYKWNSATNSWLYNMKNVNSYDNANNDTSYTSYLWQSASNKWVGSQKFSNAYAPNGVKILSIGYNLDGNQITWTATSKNIYALNIYGQDSIETDYTWKQSASKLVISQRATYYYSIANYKTIGTSTFNDLKSENTVNIYPNPATTSITIAYNGKAQLEIYSLLGYKILSINIFGETTIPLNIPKGLYIAKIRNASGFVTKNIIVK